MYSLFGSQAKKNIHNYKLPALFCVECFQNGKSPHYYSLCRDNMSTKNRHIFNNHDGKTKLKLTYWTPKQVEAREALIKWKQFYHSCSKSSESEDTKVCTYLAR